jgi:hypothetical protein
MKYSGLLGFVRRLILFHFLYNEDFCYMSLNLMQPIERNKHAI